MKDVFKVVRRRVYESICFNRLRLPLQFAKFALAMASSDFESGRKKYQIVKTVVVEKINSRMCRGSSEFLRYNFFSVHPIPRLRERRGNNLLIC